MTQSQKKLLWDIARCAERIRSFTASHDVLSYSADELVQSAVERQFEQIGEAARRLRDDSPDFVAGIPALLNAIAFRNFLIHVYDAIDHTKVWEIIEDDLPALRATILSRLNS